MEILKSWFGSGSMVLVLSVFAVQSQAAGSVNHVLKCAQVGQYDSVDEVIKEGSESLKHRRLPYDAGFIPDVILYRNGLSQVGPLTLLKVPTGDRRFEMFETPPRKDRGSLRLKLFSLDRSIALLFGDEVGVMAPGLIYKGSVDVFICFEMGPGESEANMDEKYAAAGPKLDQLFEKLKKRPKVSP